MTSRLMTIRLGGWVMILVLLSAGGSTEALAQMSPGPLSKVHHDLEGPLECAKCHVFGSGSPQFRCLDCHQEIAHRLAEKRGYHATQEKPQTGSNDCVRCHSDHNGLNHRIVRWPAPIEKFDHNQAGWRLEGKHALLKCAACHSEKFVTPQDRAVLKRRDLNTVYAGLDTACTSCHKDVHDGQLSGRCTDCHSQDSWKNLPAFSHERSRYPLTGLHARVECGKCHLPAGGVPNAPVQYRAFVQFNSCSSCHQDPHGNAFPADCGQCHATGGWKEIRSTNSFDHDRTDYPLLGKHRLVACKECHKTENFRTRVAFARCLDCHQDIHGGQFRRRSDGGDCRGCHDESSWKPAHFTVADHAASAYPLLGKHAAVACAKCHLPKGRDTVYRVPFAACTDCHQDSHQGQFAGKPHSNRCEDCHGVEGWKPAIYTPANHDQTKFLLKGAHVAVPCSDCHPRRGDDVSYHPPSSNCTDCHRDVHGQTARSTRCEGCHSVNTWKEPGRFDHNQTDFALLGRHAAVDCLACHKAALESATRTIPFQGVARDCAGCHADVHGGQFAKGGDEKGCALCHTVLSWRPTEFDHSRHSTFRLDGEHERVPCQMCHNERRVVDGRMAVVYKGTPRECAQCHR
jgi:hypothetical protein